MDFFGVSQKIDNRKVKIARCSESINSLSFEVLPNLLFTTYKTYFILNPSRESLVSGGEK